MPLDDRAIAISATFTAEAIQPGLAFWTGLLGLDYEIRFAGYNQIFQQLLDPAGLFARNRNGFNVALVRLEDWLHAGVPAQAKRFVDAVRASASSPLIVVICPSTPEHAPSRPRSSAISRRRWPICPRSTPSRRPRCRRSIRSPKSTTARRRTGPPAVHPAFLRGAGHRHRAQDPRPDRAALSR